MSDRGTCRSSTRRRSHLPSPPRIFWSSGSRQANSTSRWSSSGARASRLAAHARPVDLDQDVVGQVAEQIEPASSDAPARTGAMPVASTGRRLVTRRRRAGSASGQVETRRRYRSSTPAEAEDGRELVDPVARDQPPARDAGQEPVRDAAPTRSQPRGGIASTPRGDAAAGPGAGRRDSAPEPHPGHVPVVAAEQLVAAVARERDRDVRRASSRDQEGRDLRRVGERLVVRSWPAAG